MNLATMFLQQYSSLEDDGCIDLIETRRESYAALS